MFWSLICASIIGLPCLGLQEQPLDSEYDEDESLNATSWPSGTYYATTTHFNGVTGSCGCHLNALAHHKTWAVVATAESMQYPFQCNGGHSVSCGLATAQSHRKSGLPGGCGACFELETEGSHSKKFYAAVGDICPHRGNEEWCPAKVGQENRHGHQYHFDIYQPDWRKLGLPSNPKVKAKRTKCPKSIKDAMRKSCCSSWGHGSGCKSICGKTFSCLSQAEAIAV